MKSIFATNLKKARLLKGWSQQGTATAVGITQRTYSNIECGKHEPNHATLIRLCEALDILDLKQLLTNENYFDGKLSRESSNNNLAA